MASSPLARIALAWAQAGEAQVCTTSAHVDGSTTHPIEDVLVARSLGEVLRHAVAPVLQSPAAAPRLSSATSASAMQQRTMSGWSLGASARFSLTGLRRRAVV
jgi:hypothetical protein